MKLSNKAVIFILLLLPFSQFASAYSSTVYEPVPHNGWIWGPMEYLFMIVVLLIIIMLLLTLEIMLYMRRLEREKAVAAGLPVVKKVTWLDLFKRTKDTRDAALNEHVVDGIHEYDNSPPAWFNWLFYGSIAWAACYLLYFHVFNMGDLQIAEYEKQMKEAEAVVAKAQERAIVLADKPPYTDEAKLLLGKTIFIKNCVMCHGDKGQGIIGPNLTDDYWLHGGSYKDIFKTIFNGVPEKGMLTWKKTLKPDEIRSVASYVYTLRGSHPDNPKPPQGEKYTDASASDDSKPGKPSIN
jgi:mono/diheme cytochrome c family protein/competence protein ComGC